MTAHPEIALTTQPLPSLDGFHALTVPALTTSVLFSCLCQSHAHLSKHALALTPHQAMQIMYALKPEGSSADLMDMLATAMSSHGHANLSCRPALENPCSTTCCKASCCLFKVHAPCARRQRGMTRSLVCRPS